MREEMTEEESLIKIGEDVEVIIKGDQEETMKAEMKRGETLYLKIQMRRRDNSMKN